ncbi:MAG: 50S ribosomal protein L30 [Holosporaceae bacterium]|jgi:large subunit ribosomal protein L30|nr:50S ribosomal protein L30 [Holosporaceae bacterium]
MTKASEKAKKILWVQQTGSGIGCEKSQVLSLRALGLGKIGRKVVLQDNGCTRGLIRKVSHLVKVGDANE